MRSVRNFFGRSAGVSAVVATAIAMTIALSSGAEAGGKHKERVFDDSFGNLVIISPSGYKRIVVGAGYLAQELEAMREPKVVYMDEYEDTRHVRRCHRPPYRWVGRSRMYGLEAWEVPTAPVVCD